MQSLNIIIITVSNIFWYCKFNNAIRDYGETHIQNPKYLTLGGIHMANGLWIGFMCWKTLLHVGI